MRSVVFIVAIVMAASCGGNKTGNVDGGGGAGSDLAMAGPPDLAPRPIAGIACGANTCTTTLEFCCTSDNGASGDCEKVQNPMCGASEFQCDGPEDCPPAMPECCVSGGFAACYATGYCESQTSANFMCHTNIDCPTGTTCHLATASPYGICF